MSILKSMLFGCEGTYNLFGIPVKFTNEVPAAWIPRGIDGAGFISQLALRCLNNRVFNWITQGYTHVFVHEMSHALANQLLIGQNSEVFCYTSLCVGQVKYPQKAITLSDWKKTITDIAGPIGNMAFSTCKLVAATALKNYLSWPVTLALGGGAVIWMTGELFYACVSAYNGSQGDFGCIGRRGNAHLALASIALVSQYALGIFAAIKLAA